MRHVPLGRQLTHADLLFCYYCSCCARTARRAIGFKSALPAVRKGGGRRKWQVGVVLPRSPVLQPVWFLIMYWRCDAFQRHIYYPSPRGGMEVHLFVLILLVDQDSPTNREKHGIEVEGASTCRVVAGRSYSTGSIRRLVKSGLSARQLRCRIVTSNHDLLG